MIFKPKELNLRVWDESNRVMIDNPKKVDLGDKSLVFMQSAGQDCHGSIVHEGDLLLLQSDPEYDGQYVYVMFCEQCDEFKLHDLDSMCLCCDHQNDSKIHEGELTGNIFEDSMLLWNELKGIAPDATGDMLSEDFVRHLREQEDRQ